MNLKRGGSLSTGVDDFDGHPMNYKVPDFGLDHDILDSFKSLKDTEKRLGKWKYWNPSIYNKKIDDLCIIIYNKSIFKKLIKITYS